MTFDIIRGDALHLPLEDASVDLVVTSPPYFGLRSYQDAGEHYTGQLGSEPTPAEFVDALLAATAEMVRVLKPSGSIFVNLGDSYSGKLPGPPGDSGQRAGRSSANEPEKAGRGERARRDAPTMTREDAAWLAGVIDSDGSIGIHVNKQPKGNAPSFVPWVRIGQMRPEVVHHAAALTGTGQVMQDGRGVWNWSASAQQARWVLERIHPWLLIKKRQAWAAVEVARHVQERNARGSWRPLTADDIAHRQRYKEAVNAWNQGERDDLDPPEPPPVSLPVWPTDAPAKSLRLVPHLYALRCIHELGLTLRAEICWAKPNGLPESVTDRVRRSHEYWFHFTVRPRYYSAVDEIREAYDAPFQPFRTKGKAMNGGAASGKPSDHPTDGLNPLGKLPGSVWTVPTQPLTVPAHLGVDHFAAFPMEWPRRIIRGWSPPGVCSGCGEGLRPVVVADLGRKERDTPQYDSTLHSRHGTGGSTLGSRGPTAVITGYVCACQCAALPENYDAPTTPAVVLDPFGGTGTTALVAHALGRHGISVDMSADYCRLAEWRCNDRGQLAAALEVDKPAAVPDGQLDIFGEALA